MLDSPLAWRYQSAVAQGSPPEVPPLTASRSTHEEKQGGVPIWLFSRFKRQGQHPPLPPCLPLEGTAFLTQETFISHRYASRIVQELGSKLALTTLPGSVDGTRLPTAAALSSILRAQGGL